MGFTAYVLPDPYRVVIDLPQVAFDLPLDAGQNTLGLVSAFRYGPVGQDRARIVLDTTGPVLIEKSFILEPQAGQPARIVVDLVETGEAEFAARLKADERTSLAAIGDAGRGNVQMRWCQSPAQARQRGGSSLRKNPPATGRRPPPRGDRSGPRRHRPRRHRPPQDREKDVVLAYGLELKKVLEASGNINVVMTRSDDRFLTLRERVRIARENEADLFIAIHADTVRGPEARGATIYTLSEKASTPRRRRWPTRKTAPTSSPASTSRPKARR